MSSGIESTRATIGLTSFRTARKIRRLKESGVWFVIPGDYTGIFSQSLDLPDFLMLSLKGDALAQQSVMPTKRYRRREPSVKPCENQKPDANAIGLFSFKRWCVIHSALSNCA